MKFIIQNKKTKHYLEEHDIKPEIGERSNRPILELVVEPSNVETYLNKIH